MFWIVFDILNTRSLLGFDYKQIWNIIEEIVFEKKQKIAISEDNFFNNVSNILLSKSSQDLVFEISKMIQQFDYK